MAEDMKIEVCMITAYFPPVVGGTEIQSLRLAKALIAQNVSPFVITRRLPRLKRFEEVEGVPVHRLFTLGSGTIASILFMISSFIFLFKNRNKYQIIHAHLASSPAITATITGKLLRKKVLIKFGCGGKTGNIQTSRKTFLGRAKLEILMKYADVFVCPSVEVEREVVGYGFTKEKVLEIPNGVDTVLFHPVDDFEKEKLRKRLGFPAFPVLIYSGRLVSRKRLAVLLPAWREVTKVRKSQLLILGDGSEKARLISLAKELKIGEFVKFTGQVDNVNEYLQAADGFVFPSSAEGLSNALLEAMSTGLPVVATRIGGTDEAIENKKNGILIEPDNLSRLADGLITLLNHPEIAQEIGPAARRTVEENYSIDIIAQKHLKMYQEMIK